MSSYSRSRLRLSLRVALGLSLAALFLSVAGLYFSESILCVENGTGKGDALVVLGGEKNYRPSRAPPSLPPGSIPAGR